MLPIATVQSFADELFSTMSDLPTELEHAAPTGTFASVLAQVTAVLDSGSHGAETPTTTAVSPGASTTTTTLAPALPSATSPVDGTAVVVEAAKFVGTPYVWGGESPSGFDCSGLVQYVYGELGVDLPRTTYTQVKAGTAVASITQAQPGDLVFFAGSDGTPASPGHVGIYVGGGKMIDAPHTGTDVQVQTVSTAGPVVAIRRVLPQTGAGTFTTASVAASSTPASTAPVAVPSSMASLFSEAGTKYGVSPTLLAAVARQESGFTPDAVSPAGAEGMMQLMPETASELRVTPFTPAQAVDGAARLLSGYIHQYGSIPMALAAYSAGPSAVAEHDGVPPYPQTQQYVAAIMKTIGAAT